MKQPCARRAERRGQNEKLEHEYHERGLLPSQGFLSVNARRCRDDGVLSAPAFLVSLQATEALLPPGWPHVLALTSRHGQV